MEKQILNQLKDFEKFIEEMEDIKKLIVERDGGNLAEFDLRDAYGSIDQIPMCLEDYTKIWFGTIKENYYKFLNKRDAADEYYLDVYQNDNEAQSAYFYGMSIWMQFKQDGINIINNI